MKNTFIDVEKIEQLLEAGKNSDSKRVDEVITHARKMKGLGLEEVAVLLGVEDRDTWEEIFKLAKEIKLEIYGRRIVLFAPLYVNNYCSNDCLYCGFRCSNKDIERHALTNEELAKEVLALENAGHKRLLMVYGEHPRYGIDYMTETIETAYATKTPDGKGEIRRININAAPMSVKDYAVLKKIGIGTNQVFQETYHPGMYSKVHPKHTKKGDFAWRLYALHRAQEAGLDDVAIGALFGLYDWKFEIMGLLSHAIDMEKQFNVGPHTISFPRLEPAVNTPFNIESPYRVPDEDFKKVIAVIRLMVPYTGMILTAREKPALRREYISLGVSQIDGGSRIDVGGYQKDKEKSKEEKAQFEIFDRRTLDEVVRDLVEMGFIPSFCTSCYRSSRTGEHFMELAKGEGVSHMCQPNAILTFTEFLTDYASKETQQAAKATIKREIDDLSENQRKVVNEKLEQIRNGTRDVFF